jgi:acetate---CoA ligase (ADP-forming)
VQCAFIVAARRRAGAAVGRCPSNGRVEGVNVSEPATALQAAQAKVAALLNPRNVVIVGASDAPGSWALRAFQNLRRYDFRGPVYPVNPRRDQVWNMRCYRGFADLPEPPDHVVVVIPATQVPDTLRAAAAAGARSATVMSSGFGEAEDAAAKALAETLRKTIAETGLAVSGPNCMGNIHAPSRLMTLTDDRPHRIAEGPVAIVAQSGGLAMAIKRTLEERGIATASLVTSGNEAGLSTADYIAYFATLPFVRVIVSYLEAVQDPEHWRAACAVARSAGKPVVALKLGASAEGRAAALAHTGAVAGSMEEFDALAASAGILRVRTLDDIVEAVEYFTHVPLPAGANLGGITFSGALRGLLLDAAAANGLTFPALAPATRKRLEAVLGVGTFIGNPLDSGFAGLGSKDVYIECVSALLDDPAIDILLLQEELPRGPGSERKEANLHAVNALAPRSKKPIVHVTMISHGVNDYARSLRAQLPNIGFMQEFDKTLRAVRAIATYAQRARQPV